MQAPNKVPSVQTQVFAVRTTTGQEKSVADLIAEKANAQNLNIIAVMAIEALKGYVVVEAVNQRDVLLAISGLRHVRGKLVGRMDFKDIEHFLTPRSPTEGLTEGDIVEIIGGPFKGEKAKVTSIYPTREEVVLQLLESTYPIPIKVHADFIKVIQKAEKE